MTRRTVEFVLRGPLARWMRRRGWGGVCVVLPLVSVILYWFDPAPGTRVHERTHAEQAERWGAIGWWWRYLTELRRGYRENALEREAYDRQAICEEQIVAGVIGRLGERDA